MRILWLCAMMLPVIAENNQLPPTHGGGWLDGLSRRFVDSEHKLIIVFPQSGGTLKGTVGNITYQSFVIKDKFPLYKYDSDWQDAFSGIIREYAPDIVHIWGTEHMPSLAMVRAINGKIPYCISLHGLPEVIANHYTEGLPGYLSHLFTVRDFLRQDNISQQKKKYLLRAKCGTEMLNTADSVIGRTDYDHAYAVSVNPSLHYYCCHETLRDVFYQKQWSYDSCEKHSIFCSQVHYPIKGFHYFLQAMKLVARKYDDLKVYVSGTDITAKGMLREGSYGRYIKKLIEKYKLTKHIVFVGPLSENAMCEQYLRSNVFVSSSLTENESNSISEAKILGVPVVASFVGGVTERIRHYHSGYFYQQNEPFMLAFYIDRLFSDRSIDEAFSENERREALELHDKANNLNNHLAIYEEIINRFGGKK